MNLNLFALVIAATASIALGIAVYQRTADRVWNRLFAMHAAVIGLWAFCNYLIMASQTPAEAGLYLRLSHPLAALVACTIVDFAWVFPERIVYARRKRRWLLYGLGLVFASFGFAPDLYRSIELTNGVVNVHYGWPLIPFGLFIIITMGYGDIILLLKAFRLEGVQRVQVIWVLVGLAGTHLVGMMAIIIIPLVWGTTAYSGWGAGGAIIQVVFMSYAIAQHQLMSVQMALRRVAATAVSVTAVLVAGLLMMQLARPLMVFADLATGPIHVGVGLAMGLLAVLVYDRTARGIGRMLSSGRDPESVQAETASHILRTLDADQLLNYLTHALEEALEPANVGVYTPRAQGGVFTPRTWLEHSGNGSGASKRGRPGPVRSDSLVVGRAARDGVLLNRDQIFRFASLADAQQLASEMDSLPARIVAPMIWEQDLIGLVAVGPKRSGDMYSDSDLRFIADMSLQASLALRNADLYAQAEALKDFNERILGQMDNAVIVADAEEIVIVFNRAAERLFGVKAADVIGRSIGSLPDSIASCIRASLGSGRGLPSRHVDIERDGRIIPVACSASPLRGDAEDAQGAIAVISDLTLIQELEHERQEAERLALIRVISAGMAHEIRNPLVAIRTFAELAPRRLDDPEFRSNFLTVVQAEITRIDRLVGDLLTLSKPADAVVEPLDIVQTCREAVRATSGMAEARNINLQMDIGEIDRLPRGDGTRLHQALLNLISNAIDAEPQNGCVSLAVAQETSDRGAEVVRIRVHNPASYIPPDQEEEIFRPFVSKKARGTGLGLAISQTIIEEHNGHISIHSTPDGGTEFTVELPLPKPNAVARAGDV